MKTDDIKILIPQWVTDTVISDIGGQFDPPILALEAIMKNIKNWKRENKIIYPDGKIERIFDCRPLDGQLRLYVVSE